MKTKEEKLRNVRILQISSIVKLCYFLITEVGL